MFGFKSKKEKIENDMKKLDHLSKMNEENLLRREKIRLYNQMLDIIKFLQYFSEVKDNNYANQVYNSATEPLCYSKVTPLIVESFLKVNEITQDELYLHLVDLCAKVVDKR